MKKKEEHPACKNGLMSCWRGYLYGLWSEVQNDLHGPGDATHCHPITCVAS